MLDRRVVEWPSISGCGPETVTRVAARSGGFDILAREGDSACGRSPLSATRRATTTGVRLTLGDDRVVLEADGSGLSAAATGDTLLVTSGLRWATLRGAYDEIASGRLAETPVSVPGCPMHLSSSDTAPWAHGWFVTFDYFECDVDGSRYAFYDERVAALTMLETSWPGIASAARRGDGVAFLGGVRPGVEPTRLTVIGDPRSTPVVHEVAATGYRATLSRWPFGAPSDLALVFVDRGPDDSWTVQLVVVSEAGRERLGRRVALPDPYTLAGYGVTSVDAAVADFGIVVVLTFAWEGGRLDAGYAVVTLGPDGTLLGGALIEADLGAGDVSAAVAAAGPHALVSVLPVGGGSPHQAILLGCPR